MQHVWLHVTLWADAARVPNGEERPVTIAGQRKEPEFVCEEVHTVLSERVAVNQVHWFTSWAEC